MKLYNFFKQYLFQHKYYGKCYYPYYNKNSLLSDEVPNIYNTNGDKMEIFFLRDEHFAHSPYALNHKIENKYFLWDRFNFGLKTHFYTGKNILETMGKPTKKIAWIIEPRSILEKPYNYFYKYKGLHEEFDYILTHDEKILNDFPNAKFIYTAGVWCYLEKNDNLTWSENKFQIKDKNISMVVSGKNFTLMHQIRNTIADKVKDKIDIFGAYVNKPIQFKSQSLDKYKYQIVIENEISSYGFTEKILDCFISQCIPIYIGATKINEFFNLDGIIKLSPDKLDDLENILLKCNEKEYFSRLEAVLDNYHRSLKYLNCNNLMYEKLFKEQ